MDFKVVIIGGSFNPPTFSHLAIGDFILKSKRYDKIIFIPCGFRNDKINFASNEIRLKMLILAIKQFFNITPTLMNSNLLKNLEEVQQIKNDILIDLYEIEENKDMIPTALILKMYQDKFSNINLFFAMGSDLLSSIRSWDFYHEILQYQQFIIFERANYPVENYEIPPYSNVIYNEIPKNISSTKIRDIIITMERNEAMVKLRKYTVLDVVDFIFENKLYIN